jgi:hypothetical protein
VAAKVREMGAAICADYAGKQVAIIGVLNGAFIFTSGARERGGWEAALAGLPAGHPDSLARLTPAPHHTTPHDTDLVREVSKAMPDVKVDFLRASSYGSASSSSGDVTVQATSDLQKWAGYHILLVRASACVKRGCKQAQRLCMPLCACASVWAPVGRPRSREHVCLGAAVLLAPHSHSTYTG